MTLLLFLFPLYLYFVIGDGDGVLRRLFQHSAEVRTFMLVWIVAVRIFQCSLLFSDHSDPIICYLA